jgi:hypothetical protein
MKKIIAFMCLAFFVGCVTLSEEERTKQEIIQFPKMSKKIIYDKSLLFLAQRIPNANGEFNYKNPAEGKIAGNVETHSSRMSDTYYFRNSISIETKEGRAKITVIPLTQKVCTYLKVCTNDNDISWNNAALENAQFVIDSYKKYMNQGVKNENW